tara:strand:- start:128 stop:283 length:156 start_codon:yes stop_codon:yes gene_type:complete
MPQVGNRHYPYTAKGKAAAKKAVAQKKSSKTGKLMDVLMGKGGLAKKKKKK